MDHRTDTDHQQEKCIALLNDRLYNEHTNFTYVSIFMHKEFSHDKRREDQKSRRCRRICSEA